MGVSASATASGLILSLTLLAWVSCVAFGFQNVPLTQNAAFVGRKLHQRQSSSSLNMVFDFFKQRSQEGMDQLSKLSDAAKQGKLGEGLIEVANYSRETQKIMADGLAKSRNQFLYNLEGVLSGDGWFGEDWLDGLEDALLQADLGPATANDVLSEVRSLRQDSTQLFTRDDLRSILRGKLVEALRANGADSSIRFSDDTNSGDDDDDDDNNDNKQSSHMHVPTVLFIMGANGQGKTTSIGKLAHRLRTEGNQTVLVAACDTFRAGAVAQLEQWADRAGVDCFGPSTDATSPSSVCYGALDKAIQQKYDTLLVDTSGRLSNNEPLTEELKKMKRVIQIPDLNTNVPHETLLVLDAAQGRMALDSAKIWHEELGLTGLILTKLDGSARGGSVVAVSRELGLPVKLIGVGEGMEDLRDVST
jgi:fused signal recognition particle receptor